MLGMRILKAMLGKPAPGHIPLGAERNSVMDVVRRMDVERIPASGDADLSEAVAEAIRTGRDIRQIGCSPHSIRSDADGHEVDVEVRLEGEGFQRLITMRMTRELRPVWAVQRSIRPVMSKAV